MPEVKINIFLPIYLHGGSIHRTRLTAIIFQHYKNIQELFKSRSTISFTILGSEGKLSKDLALTYFKEEEYFEFDQDLRNFKNDFLFMLGEKYKTGLKIASKTNADIILLAGSNDYICYDFYDQIISYYNNKNPQLYGIDNYKNGGNVVNFVFYDGLKNVLLHDDGYWWNGKSNYCGRARFHYCGATIGVNRACYVTYPDVLENINFDEGQIEEYILKKPNMDKFTSNNCYYFNIKTPDNKEITSFSQLKKLNEVNILLYKKISIKLRQKIIKTVREFEKLCVVTKDMELLKVSSSVDIINDNYKKFTLIPIKTEGKPGELVDINLNNICREEKINFNTTKYFYVNELNSKLSRGNHSNSNASEILICLKGAFEIKLHDGKKEEIFKIVKNEAIYINKNIWIEFYNFNDCVIMGFVDIDINSEKKYSCYDLNEFLSNTK